MDEQPIQDYLNLIQQLLNCPSGQEIEILHENSLLIDKGFVKEIEEVAFTVGDNEINAANWLHNLSAQLAEAITNWSELNQQVIEFYHQGNYDRAAMIGEQALELAQNLWGERHPDFATSLNNLAAIYKHQGFYNEAEVLYNKALATKRDLLGEGNLDVAASMNNLAGLYELQGRYDEAKILVFDALMIRKSLLGDEHHEVATSIANLAAIYELQGRYSEAEEEHKKALEMRKYLLGDEHLDVALSLNNLALLYYCQGRYSEAEPYYKEVLAIYKKMKQEEHPDIATILNNLGAIYSAQKRYKESETFYVKALVIRKRLLGDKHPNVATSLNNLATLYLKKGCYFEAEQNYKESLEIYRSRGEAHQVANLLGNLASVYYFLNLYSLAESFSVESLVIRKSLLGERHPDIALCLNNIAEIYGCQGRYDEAEAYYLEALEITKDLLGHSHPNVSNNLHNLAGLLTVTNRPAQALEKMWEAAEVDERIIRRVFATSSEQGRLINLQTVRTTLDLLLSLVLHHLSDSAEAKGSALNVVLKRKSLTATALAVQSEALYSGRYSHLSEQFKKLCSLNEQIIDLIYSLPRQQQLSITQQHLTELESEADKLQRQLASEVQEIQWQEQLADRQIVATELPKGSALVEFVRFDTFNFTVSGGGQWQAARYLAFILPAGQPESVEMIDIGEAEYIDSLIREFRELVSGRGNNTESQLGMFNKRPPKLIFREYHPQSGVKLRQAIFDKLRPYIQEDEHLIIAPDGELNLVPFQILPNDNTGEKMLMDEFTISYLTVGRDIMRQKIETKRSASLNALVFACPNFDLSAESITFDATQKQNTQTDNLRESIANNPLKPAVGTNILGERVAQRLKVAPYVENEALEGYFKPLQCPRILLMATHGVFLPDRPEDRSPPFRDRMESGLLQQHDRFWGRVENPMLRSALALAGANTWAKGGKLPPEAGKGILFAQDVAGLDLWANEITVLSACETAIGDVAIGEGVFGLRRAFAVAGAKTLIISLWSVNGWTTTLLMERFFDNCEAGNGRAASLQEAQNYVRNITVRELQQFELGREILKYEFNNARELDNAILAHQADDKPLRHPYYWGAWICQGDTKPIAIAENSQ